jgi:hypothetical protein
MKNFEKTKANKMIQPEGAPTVGSSSEVQIIPPHLLDDEFAKSDLVQNAVAEIMAKITTAHALGDNRTYFDTTNHRLARILEEKFSLHYEVESNRYPDSYQGPGGTHLIFRWPDF